MQNNHVCVENSMRQNCPVCFEYLFDSVRPTAVLPCGHTIHSDCLREMERNRSVAPRTELQGVLRDKNCLAEVLAMLSVVSCVHCSSCQ